MITLKQFINLARMIQFTFACNNHVVLISDNLSECFTKANTGLEQKEEEIKKGNKIIGLAEVTGPGVIVTLTDSKKDINREKK